MNHKLRICFLAPLHSIHTKRWLDHFDSLGHQVFLYRGSGKDFVRWHVGDSLPDEFGSVSTDSKQHGWARLQRFVGRVVSLRHHISQIEPDVVHALWLYDNAFNALLTGMHPYVVTPWGSDIRMAHSLSLFRKIRLWLAFRHADAITAPTTHMLQLCQRVGARPERCYQIAIPGTDIERFERPRPTGLRERLGIPDGTEVILSVRGMQFFYRIHTIVSAFRRVHRQRPKTKLLLMVYNEEPGYLQRIKRQILDEGLQGSVVLLEDIPYPFDGMPELYGLSSLVVSIPEDDAIPQSGYEAFAAGRPLVASNLATYDGVIENEKTALCVAPDDSEQVARAIMRILEDDSLRPSLIANGLLMVREKGDIRREMAKMEELYFRLCRLGSTV